MGYDRGPSHGARPGITAAEQVGGPEQVGLVAELAGQAGEAEPAALHDVGAMGQAGRNRKYPASASAND
jgi:hypothetical protein